MSDKVNFHELHDDDLADPSVIAAQLDTTVNVLSVWRSNGRIDLPWVKIGRSVKYRVGDVRDFLQRNTTTHTTGTASKYKATPHREDPSIFNAISKENDSLPISGVKGDESC